ncbi:MAG: toxin-antitoxin system TumE family protein [Candidatus Brocadiales bacterium]
MIGYDNAERKGDHRHYGEKMQPYMFESLQKLAEDFYSDVQRFREGKL